MSIRDVINVRTCKLDWAIPSPQFPGPHTFFSPVFFATTDVNLSWRLKLEFDQREYILWRAVLTAEYGKHNSGIFPAQSLNNRGPIAGEATLKLKSLNSNNFTKTLKTSFICTEENLTSNTGSDNVVCCYKVIIDDLNSAPEMTLTCEVSYLNLNETVPILISNRYVTVPIETSSLFIPSVDFLFEEMYLNKKYSDVVLCVNGTDFYAHKNILAAHSKVFEAMFQHNMQENILNRVEVQNIDELAFLQALHYMYTGRVDDMESLVYNLLPVADRYDIRGLKVMCENLLSSKLLSVKTVVRILVLAETCNADGLKTQAKEFMSKYSSNVVKAMSSEEWDALEARPRLMKEVLFLCMHKK